MATGDAADFDADEGDLLEVMGGVRGKLDQVNLAGQAAGGVREMASGGYPGAYEKGKVIRGLDEAGAEGCDGVSCGHARNGDDIISTAGQLGR